MKTFLSILMLLFSIGIADAQRFYVDNFAKNDAFAAELANVLNNSNNQFNQYKFKPVLQQPEEYAFKVHLFRLKKILPGALQGYLFSESKSKVWVEYTFANTKSINEGLEQIKRLTAKMYKALNRKLVLKNGNYQPESNLVFEKKMAYAVNNGFFDFNMFLQLKKNSADSSYKVILKIVPPKPVYYYWVFKQQPTGSFNMALAVKSGVNHIENTIQKSGCPVDIMPFQCDGQRQQNDTLFYSNSKTGFDGLADAINEYQAAFDNVKAAMGNGYVYFLQRTHTSNEPKVTFVKFSDIDKDNAPFVTMQLVKTNQYATISKLQYKIVLVFAMPGY
jgi:hypothetical protein